MAEIETVLSTGKWFPRLQEDPTLQHTSKKQKKTKKKP